MKPNGCRGDHGALSDVLGRWPVVSRSNRERAKLVERPDSFVDPLELMQGFVGHVQLGRPLTVDDPYPLVNAAQVSGCNATSTGSTSPV